MQGSLPHTHQPHTPHVLSQRPRASRAAFTRCHWCCRQPSTAAERRQSRRIVYALSDGGSSQSVEESPGRQQGISDARNELNFSSATVVENR